MTTRQEIALVVSASRGIGKSTALALARKGVAVAITGRKEESLQQAALHIREETGVSVLPIVAHSGRDDDRTEVVRRVVDELGALDVLVYNTGTNPAGTTAAMELNPQLLRLMFDTNVVAALDFVQLAWCRWMAEHGGAIVMVNTVSSLVASRMAAYSATKAALLSLTRDLADQLAPTVRVNTVAPAFIDTTFAHDIWKLPRDRVAAAYPMGRIGKPEDVAEAVCFLASREASWITGAVLAVDGGLLAATARHTEPHPAVDQIVH